MTTAKMRIPGAKLIDFCKHCNGSELALFDSVFHADFRLVSDVDPVSKRDPDRSRNYLRRKHIPDSVQVMHDER